MANKRMFSLATIDSDSFIDLPLSAQALYFHLCMRADDEGFVNNTQRIIRSVLAKQKDLDKLVDSGFVLQFESGTICITHWGRHNTIKKDRFTETECIQERELIDIVNGIYVLRADNTLETDLPDNDNDPDPNSDQSGNSLEPICEQSGTEMETEWNQSGNSLEPQVKNRLDKVKVKLINSPEIENSGNSEIPENEINPQKQKTKKEIPKQVYGEFENVRLTDPELEKLKERFPSDYLEWIETLSRWKASNGKKKVNDYATILAWERREQKEKANRPTEQERETRKWTVL